MGGILAKRAYILAHQLEEFAELGKRIRAIFFLATPHRGSNLAELLNGIIRLAGIGRRSYISNLHQDSEMINDEFRHHCQGLHLHSFYETTATNLGISKRLVVEKSSAILGLPNERVNFLYANHRDMCRFGSDQDSNYRVVRNAIAALLNDLRSQRESMRTEPSDDRQIRIENGGINHTISNLVPQLWKSRLPRGCFIIGTLLSGFIGLSLFLGLFFVTHKEYGYSMGDSFSLAGYVIAVGALISSFLFACHFPRCRCWKGEIREREIDGIPMLRTTSSLLDRNV